VCAFFFKTEHVLADHTNGKRHQALLLARERFESSQNSSIYVTRIKREHDETILRTYFSRFGSIKNCFIDKEKVRFTFFLLIFIFRIIFSMNLACLCHC